MDENYEELILKLAISEKWEVIFEHFSYEQLNEVFGKFFDAIILKIETDDKNNNGKL